MKQRILMVDDEEAVLHMLKRMLQASGYEIYEANSGDEALKLDMQAKPDLVLTDLKMPVMDGLELAQELLKNRPDRPVLLMTAYADLESARKAVKVGIYEYFLKPIDMNDFLAGIQRALDHRKLVLENRAYQKDLEQKVVERTQDLAQKVRDLEARDELLRNLLSIQDPDETLGLAVQLACKLCEATHGALFIRDDKGFRLRVVLGFGADEIICDPNVLAELALDQLPNTIKGLTHMQETKTSEIAGEVDAEYKGFGLGSLGMVPVLKGQDLIAVLQVGRSSEEDPIVSDDLGRLTTFAPYIAMAIDDCLLQETLPNWQDNVEDMLHESEKWTQ